MNTTPPLMHLPYPGFIHFGHFMPQMDINVLHLLASKTWAARGRPLIMAEVGSFTGASALALVNYAETLYCIDTWVGCSDDTDPINAVYDSGPLTRGVVAAFMRNTLHVTDKIVACPETSLHAASNMADRRFDLVFIDGDHRIQVDTQSP